MLLDPRILGEVSAAQGARPIEAAGDRIPARVELQAHRQARRR